jgi:pimeloyl-ACP methyl ester carboxylesterase
MEQAMLRRSFLFGTIALAGVAQVNGAGPMTAIETKTVAVKDAELATESWGTGESGTILLAMGATASMVWWPDELLQALAEGGYRVIRFDHRDTGQSTTNPPGAVGYDVFDLSDDLMAILDAYGARSAHLGGMSLGGYVSQIAALRHPERVSSLTLIASEPLGISYESEGIGPEFMAHFGRMETLDWTDRTAVADFLVGIAELSAGWGRPFNRAAAIGRIERELGRTNSMQSAFNHSMVGGELEAGMTAAGLELPVLIVHGSEDPVISVHAAEASAAAIRGAELLILAGTGHELVANDASVIAEAMLRVMHR